LLSCQTSSEVHWNKVSSYTSIGYRISCRLFRRYPMKLPYSFPVHRIIVALFLFVLGACSAPASAEPTAAPDLLPTSVPGTAGAPEAPASEAVDEPTVVSAATEA